MKITVLEHVPFSGEQKNELSKLGEVKYCNYGEDVSLDILLEEIKGSNVVVVNWIDPSPFILSLKENSLVALMSTGYGWITNLEEARKRGVLVSNIPSYSTEAVAEHIFALLLNYTKKITITSNWTPPAPNGMVGIELKGKKLGIIGLGNIGSRVAEIGNKGFGMSVITHNRTKKNSPLAVDAASLDELLSISDIVCITCAFDEKTSANMINSSNINLLKKGSIITGATWGIIDETALLCALQSGRVGSVAFDVALEGKTKLKNTELLMHPNFFCTLHNAYNTAEAAKNQRNICIKNIESFLNGSSQNIIN